MTTAANGAVGGKDTDGAGASPIGYGRAVPAAVRRGWTIHRDGRGRYLQIASICRPALDAFIRRSVRASRAQRATNLWSRRLLAVKRPRPPRRSSHNAAGRSPGSSRRRRLRVQAAGTVVLGSTSSHPGHRGCGIDRTVACCVGTRGTSLDLQLRAQPQSLPGKRSRARDESVRTARRSLGMHWRSLFIPAGNRPGTCSECVYRRNVRRGGYNDK